MSTSEPVPAEPMPAFRSGLKAQQGAIDRDLRDATMARNELNRKINDLTRQRDAIKAAIAAYDRAPEFAITA